MIERDDKKMNLISEKMMILKTMGLKKYISSSNGPREWSSLAFINTMKSVKKEEILDFIMEWYDKKMEEGVLERNVNTISPMLTLTYLYEKTKSRNTSSFWKRRSTKHLVALKKKRNSRNLKIRFCAWRELSS